MNSDQIVISTEYIIIPEARWLCLHFRVLRGIGLPQSLLHNHS